MSTNSAVRAAPLRQAAPLALIALLVLFAWLLRFVQDDAFISFRYAENLVDGKGLVFNPGERVEGYTNFLWTVLMAAGIRLGAPVVLWSQVLGVLCFAGALALLFGIARRLLGPDAWGMLALAWVGGNYTFLSYATGGLETSLQTALVLLAFHLALGIAEDDSVPRRKLSAFSLAGAAALLARLDSAVLLAVPAVALLARLVPRSPTGRARAGDLASLLLPGAIPLLVWFAWKGVYYGDLLPATFHAKTGGDLLPTVKQGMLYLFEFFRSYWLLPQLALTAVFARSIARSPGVRWLAAAVLLWGLYLIRVGGDFMEFRMAVPALPLFTIATLGVLRERALDRRLIAGLLALSLVGSVYHARTFVLRRGIESIENLEGHLSIQRWEKIGESLGRAFPEEENGVTIAVTAAGAIPYYSGLRTIDMLGLNDAWIAKNGLAFKTQPGHEKVAPLRYLVDSRVNLVIGHPIVLPRNRSFEPPRSIDLRVFRIFDAVAADLPPGARLVEFPIDDDFSCLALYLVQSDRVEEAIRALGWRVRAIG